MEGWYVACYKPGKDNIYKAMAALGHINITAFCPQIRVHRPRADRPSQVRQIIEPLFPGYLFVAFDPEMVHTSRIEQCPGISYLLRNAGSIIPLRDHVVSEIMNLPVCYQSRPVRASKYQKNLLIAKKLEEFAQEPNAEHRGSMFIAFLATQVNVQ